MEQKTKRCPYCGEEILAIAKKCKHCGEWLDKQVVNKQKKACPVCGEMVDVDLETCPFCNEPTHFTECEYVKQTFTKGEKNSELQDDTQYLYCKTCRARLSVDADVCESCGDKDPFYFKRIKRFDTIASWGGAGSVLAIIYIAAEYMGLRINMKHEWLGFICYVIAFIVLTAIASLTIRRLLFHSSIKEFENAMQRLFHEIGKPNAINNWRAKVDKIL